jgi:urease accessory protein
MPRVQKVLAKGPLARGFKNGSLEPAPGGAHPGEIADTLLLKFDDRRRQQGFVFGGKGTCIEFDFPEPPCLHTDDLLVLDDGRLVEVVADVEPVIEVRARDLTTHLAKDFAAIARLILALGNRHVPVQIMANRIRLQKRAEAEALVAEHGLKSAELTAPFEPDDGTHAGAAVHGHDHGHHHDHGDGHGHHHGDGHGHHHDHGDEHAHGHHHD